MATIRNRTDMDLQQLKDRLDAYESDHPGATAELYRQNSASIRVRIIHDAFAAMSRTDRHDAVWKYIEVLGEDILQQVTTLILLPQTELQASMVNMEFDDPIMSAL